MPVTNSSSYLLDSLNENSHHCFENSGDSVGHFTNIGQQAILIGGGDQEGLGDLLRPHVYSRLFDFDTYRCAGLVSKNMTNRGAHDVINFGEAALEMGGAPLSLIHLGSDTLLSGLLSSYHRAAEGDESQNFVNLFQMAAREELVGYVQRRSGQTSSVAYVLSPKGIFSNSDVMFFSLRLPEPSILEEAQEEHIMHCAGESRFFGVSGKSAEQFFSDRGIACEQMPCSLTFIPTLCNHLVGQPCAAIKELNQNYGNGWVALEVSEVPEDQEQALVEAVESLCREKQWGIVLYSSRKLNQDKINHWTSLFEQATWFNSGNIWHQVQMLSKSKCYIGSCLDSRILACAYGIPRVNTLRNDRKISDYCSVWELDSLPDTLSIERDQWAKQLLEIVDHDQKSLREFSMTTKHAFLKSIGKAVDQSKLTRRIFTCDNIEHFETVVQNKSMKSTLPDRASLDSSILAEIEYLERHLVPEDSK